MFDDSVRIQINNLPIARLSDLPRFVTKVEGIKNIASSRLAPEDIIDLSAEIRLKNDNDDLEGGCCKLMRLILFASQIFLINSALIFPFRKSDLDHQPKSSLPVHVLL
jgi:hypothetical protein